MCRILFALNVPHLKRKITAFLQQTEHIDTHDERKRKHLDGFGFAWYNSLSHKWKCMKSPKIYTEVKNLHSIIDQISVSDLVVGHLRRKPEDTETSVENTHPFTYKNQLFVHNGEIKGYRAKRDMLLRHIHPDFLPHIKGETDSEIMFYLFLTFKRKLEDDSSGSSIKHKNEIPLILVNATKQLFHFLCQHFGEFTANIVYSNKSHSIITRAAHSQTNKTSAPTLYMNGGEHRTRLLISTAPLMDEHELVTENTAFIIQHHGGCYFTFGI